MSGIIVHSVCVLAAYTCCMTIYITKSSCTSQTHTSLTTTPLHQPPPLCINHRTHITLTTTTPLHHPPQMHDPNKNTLLADINPEVLLQRYGGRSPFVYDVDTYIAAVANLEGSLEGSKGSLEGSMWDVVQKSKGGADEKGSCELYDEMNGGTPGGVDRVSGGGIVAGGIPAAAAPMTAKAMA